MNMSNIYQAKGTTMAEQYRDVGTLFGQSIKMAVQNILINRSRGSNFRRLVAEQTLRRLQGEVMLGEFWDCMTAWSEGAGITTEQAMWLMADNLSGCQTLILRYSSGVALLHTEEDFDNIQERMSAPQTIEFVVDGVSSKCLVYNDILPGAGLYGWKKDFIVAVDSLFLREDGIEKIEKPMLANIVSWLIWRMKAEDAEAEIVVAKMRSLGTVVDGYAINVVRKVDEKIEGYKLTFARDDWEIEKLWDQPGDHLRQVNIIEPRYVSAKKKIVQWRHAPWKMYLDYRGFLKRLREMKSCVQKYRKLIQTPFEAKDTKNIHLAIQRLIFTELKSLFVNDYMKAMCIGLVDQSGTSVSIKLNEGGSADRVEYTDQI